MGGIHIARAIETPSHFCSEIAAAVSPWPLMPGPLLRSPQEGALTMARRNLAGREDIPADALRQRRDLYALAIGLFLYDLAGGRLMPDATFGNVLPLSLTDPHYLLAAAWIGFFYFWFRFWLVSNVKPLHDFMVDVRWQAGDSQAMRKIAAAFVRPTAAQSGPDLQSIVLRPDGPVPKVRNVGRVPTLSLTRLRPRHSTDHTAGRSVGPDSVEIPRERRFAFWAAWIAAFPAAMLRERTFTDYTLPHLFAMVTLIHGVWRHVIAPYVT